MFSTFGLSARVFAPLQPNWLGVRHALLRSAYAGLLVLVMLLPANFVAFALFSTLFHGSATGGMQFAVLHHLSGYWIGTAAGAFAVDPTVWWAAATWEVLFWASCASAVVVTVLWTARAVAGRLGRHVHRLRKGFDSARAA